MIWFWIALVLALNVGFVLGAWWNSRPRLEDEDIAEAWKRDFQ